MVDSHCPADLVGHRQEAEQMFYHGYDNYLRHAFPEDELKPVSCLPLTRNRHNPAHIELNDPLGNYSVTLIDSLSTLAVLASSSSTSKGSNKALRYFQKSVAALVEHYGDGSDGETGRGKRGRGFDVDSKVQVFETVIRGVGGLLSAHLFAVGELPIRGYDPLIGYGPENDNEKVGDISIHWPTGFVYNGQLLRLAHDLARRLLPAFYSATGLPYPRVNLRHGVPFYANSPLNQNAETGQCQVNQTPSAELTETCSAGAGSLVLEFTTLSRLTGDLRFEQLAKRAFWSVWERKSSIGLVGSGIDAETGLWVNGYTGIGAGIDSFYEYAAKTSIFLSNSPLPDAWSGPIPGNGTPTSIHTKLVSEEHQTAEAFGQVWRHSHAAIKRHLYRGDMYIHPHYVQADLYTGASRAFWHDSLSAFYPGVLAITGHLEEATGTHLLATALWTRYSALPERWSTSTGGIEHGLHWWGGRPEFIESTYYLYQATKDPWYLHVGEMVLQDIKRRCWTKCGWSGLQDVRTGERNDRMESFFLGETVKYLFLLFDPDHPLNKIDSPFVFSTEGHPLVIPRHHSHRPHSPRRPSPKIKDLDDYEDLGETMCPLPPSPIPFSISATAARPDIFHAANLARLHLMPTPDNLESPLIEYSSDHPSISISDVRSPSNYTYYPWTLPLELIPHNGTSSKITAKSTFDITFPATPNMVVGPGFLQRVGNGILINSMGGVRLGMIQDAPSQSDEGPNVNEYRVHAINNILLGKDERIFLAKDTASHIVNPLDPNFTRIRDPAMLDLVVDVPPSGGAPTPQAPSNNQQQSRDTEPANDTQASTTAAPENVFGAPDPANSEVASNIRHAFTSFLQQFAGLITVSPAPAPTPQTSQSHPRSYIPAVVPVGVGVAPLPDVEDALGPDVNGASQGSLLYQNVYVTGQNCDAPLQPSVPKNHEILILKRGGCSFDEKLRNIPTFAPSKTSLKLVIVVSYEDEPGLPPGFLIRPLLEQKQSTSSGLPRHNPIPMVMVAGGEETYGVFERAIGVGIKRRYSVQAQGVPISNLVML